LIEFMEECPVAGAAGANLLNPDGTLQNGAYPMLGLGTELWRLFHLDRLHRLASYPLHEWASGGPRRVGVAQGACLALRREALDQVGLLDERYFMYTEEVDLCYRLARGGWEVYWLPEARVLHFGGQSTRQAEAEMFLALYQSKVRFFRKHFGVGQARAYKLILALASLPRLFHRVVGDPGSGSGPSPRSSVARHYRRLLASLHQM
jgi:GT2 family glycosyltransferase